MKNLLTITGASVLALTLATDLTAAAPKADQGNSALKSQVEMLMKRVNELEAKEKTVGDLTEKEAATTGNNLNVVISGQVNRAVLWHDDGTNSNVVHVDPSDEASSRLRVEATGKLSQDSKVGAVLEMDLRSNQAEWTDVHNAKDSNNTFRKRKVKVFIASERWGKVILGHDYLASARVTRDTDMSKTGAVSMGDTVGQLAGGTIFTQKNLPTTTPAPGAIAANKATTMSGAPLNVKSVFNGADNHREDLVKYETPTFWGTQLATSHSYKGNNDMWDVAIKHACEVLGTKIAAQAAYFRNLANTGGGHSTAGAAAAPSSTRPAKYHQWSGSVGALFPVGLSVMFAVTHRNWKLKDARDGKIYFGKVGYQQNFFEAGLTALALDYGHFQNMILNRGDNNTNNNNTDPYIKNRFVGKTYGATLVQHIDRVGTELYITARTYALEGEKSQVARYRDITMFMSGMRVKF